MGRAVLCYVYPRSTLPSMRIHFSLAHAHSKSVRPDAALSLCIASCGSQQHVCWLARAVGSWRVLGGTAVAVEVDFAAVLCLAAGCWLCLHAVHLCMAPGTAVLTLRAHA
jgi:hypothetical protein